MKTGPRFKEKERAAMRADIKELWGHGFTLEEIAHHHEISLSYVRNVLFHAQRPNPPGVKLPDELRRWVRELFSGGFTGPDISNLTDVSCTTIYKWCADLVEPAAA